MIEDSKWVKSVESNAPKKGWKITWHDDKKDNIFDESWLKILDEAQKDNRLVHFTKEKNNAGYWNILNLNLVDGSELPPATEVETRHTDVKPDPVISTKNRAFALSYAKDIFVARIGAGHADIKASTIIQWATLFDNWLNGVDNKNIEE